MDIGWKGTWSSTLGKKFTDVQYVEIHLVLLRIWKSTNSPTVERSHTSARTVILHFYEQAILEFILEDIYPLLSNKKKHDALGSNYAKVKCGKCDKCFHPKSSRRYETRVHGEMPRIQCESSLPIHIRSGQSEMKQENMSCWNEIFLIIKLFLWQKKNFMPGAKLKASV